MTREQKIIEFAKGEIGFRDKEEREKADEIKIPVVHIPGMAIEPKSYLVTFKRVIENDIPIWRYQELVEYS